MLGHAIGLRFPAVGFRTLELPTSGSGPEVLPEAEKRKPDAS